MRLGAKALAQLLVDGDQGSIELIEQAIEHLQGQGRSVVATVFAEPRRVENKQWHAFLRERRIKFCPVPRRGGKEATDLAIESRLVRLSQSPDDLCVALLTSDTDFVDIVEEVAASKDMIVFLPQSRGNAARKYRATSATVVPIGRSEEGPKVRAILHPDGSGSVEMAEPWQSPIEEEAEHLTQFLQDLGYHGERGLLVQGIAKFWVSHRLGPLTVYPAGLGCESLHKLLQAAGSQVSQASWTRYSGDIAFFLPTTKAPAKTRIKVKEYGTMHARAVFKGGGPFTIKASRDMVAQALRRLGYLDGHLSCDLAEALLAFVNLPENKQALRKRCDALPTPTDTVSDVVQKLHRAFLAHDTGGRWRVAPSDTQVRKTLCKHGFLMDEAAPQSQVLEAMQQFARGRGLKEMRSYIGYVFRIQQHMYCSDPTKVGNVDFRA